MSQPPEVRFTVFPLRSWELARKRKEASTRARRRLMRLFEEQGGKCYWCRKEMYPPEHPLYRRSVRNSLSGKALTLDHIWPRWHPGREAAPDKHAKVAACNTCNGNRDKAQYRAIKFGRDLPPMFQYPRAE